MTITASLPDLRHIAVRPRTEHITDVVLDRHPGNALDETLIGELALVADHLSGPGRTRVVVLTSAQPEFMVGADLNMMNEGWAKVQELIRTFQDAVTKWERIPSPTIAVLSGHALGAGCELALACDFRIMSAERARIGLPEVRRGLISAGGGTQRMARVVGRAVALDMCLRGRMLSGHQAAAVSLVHEACSAATLPIRSAALAEELAALPPLTAAAIKECILDGLDTDLAGGLEIEEAQMVEIGRTEDAREGVASFLEKREPKFTGR
jgi:enoyl-CoA hydratase/carnithine racemase